ncbi:hypothetical protein L6452_05364 [Arctium lappa]|uniref:Uncharacterized protein n=1 Tax=Arctium lappa TaxID=4217 RepID=A0ACB9EGH6_ARCLA|nr:hypothetical protein L6452_05364 [Arctium lappa]
MESDMATDGGSLPLPHIMKSSIRPDSSSTLFTSTSPRSPVNPTSSRENPVTRPPFSHGVQDVLYHVSPAFLAAVLTVLDKEPTLTCVMTVACAQLPGSGIVGTGRSM